VKFANSDGDRLRQQSEIEAQREHAAEELKRLQGCVNDLIGKADERKRAEAPLQQSEMRFPDGERDFELTIDSIPVFVATYRPDGTRSFVGGGDGLWRQDVPALSSR